MIATVVLKLILILISGILLSAVWFGLLILVSAVGAKTGSKLISVLRPALAAAIPAAVILFLCKDAKLNFFAVGDWVSWLIILVTVPLTSLVISKNRVSSLPSGSKLLLYGLDGVLMEIPQRLMMQSFLMLLLNAFGLNAYLSVLLNALVWCASICLQYMINKAKPGREAVLELVSSFVFSVGVGIVFVRTGFIFFTMFAHFVERLLSTEIRKKTA